MCRLHYNENFLAGGAVWPNPLSPPTTDSRQPLPANAPTLGQSEDLPPRFGRYRILARLGAGSFGVVYRGRDEELQREVAIKVPHRRRIAMPEDAEAYLAEARILASLDHPGIVPVYDIGRAADGLCFVVSKFIEGTDLKTRLQQSRPSIAEAVEIAARVAEALDHAHRRGLVHRDVKPANILLDGKGNPFVADFGLALREEDFGTGPQFAGTPAYMSPEQARGEGHRVDARTDIFSLGVVSYELLTGRRPFQADNWNDLLEQIRTQEPRPPRQLDDTIPRELDRICLKCLGKRASDRYSTAADLADDLRHWQAGRVAFGAAPVGQVVLPAGAPPAAAPTLTDPDRRPVKIVPRGLRSFEATDADFFLELLPGPRDRDGLPDSIRFWKTRIEETDPDQTFSVGLIYGPSGCGKSSLIKAGLLPRLARRVMAVYLEATPGETEARLLRGLRKRCPDLPAGLGLADTLAHLRRHRVPSSGSSVGLPDKVLIVLDQSEQWLNAKPQGDNSELVQALRHCDGQHVQCLILVRDDFWMAATRLMQALEVPLFEGRNSAAVDLFDPRHARKVLTAYGRAFDALPEGNLTADQERFLDQAVAGLTEDSKVITVRLSLFAEMVKGRPWTPATLKEVGGIEGVGLTFLEETFSAPTAPPEHRRHRQAACAVLQALLPEPGANIKGNMRSRQALLEVSGYARRPRDFDDLLRILDAELRLVTPTDPEGIEEELPAKSAGAGGGRSSGAIPEGERFYQLTHDYIVPALRDWLTRKQRESRRGRAELRLAERAALWQARQEKRHLPSWWEWVKIRLFTAKRDWTPAQRQMMRAAGRHYALRSCAQFLLVALTVWIILETISYWWASALLQDLDKIEDKDLSLLISDLQPHRRWAKPILKEKIEKGPSGKERAHACRILLDLHPGEIDCVCLRLLKAEPNEYQQILYALKKDGARIATRLWDVLDRPTNMEGERVRAAYALLLYDPENPRWTDKANELVPLMAQGDFRSFLGRDHNWTLRSNALTKPLVEIAQDVGRPWLERGCALGLLSNCETIPPDVRAELILSHGQLETGLIGRIWGRPEEDRDRVVAALEKELTRKLPPEAGKEERESLTRRQRNAVSALLSLRKSDNVRPELLAELVTLHGQVGEHPIERILSEKSWEYRDRVVSVLEQELTRELRPEVAKEERESLVRRWRYAVGALVSLHRADSIQPEFLAKFIAEAGLSTDHVEKLLAEKPRTYRTQVLSLLKAELARKLPSEAGEDERESLTRRQGRAAVALASLGKEDWVWPLLQRSADPDLRTLLIHSHFSSPRRAMTVLDRLETEMDDFARQALILNLDLSGSSPRSSDLFARLMPRYRQDPDPGVHSALGWLLRQMEPGPGQLAGIDQEFISRGPVGNRRWYVNSQGHTLAVVKGPVEFLMGSPDHEHGRGKDETLHRRRIPRSSALATKEVTVEQFKRFLRDNPTIARNYPDIDELDPGAAVASVTWFEAVQYCRWLSEQEQIPEGEMCYPPIAEIEKARHHEEGLKLPAEYLTRTGYRLPTEAEWEYACRAGTVTSRPWGASMSLAGKYAWYGALAPPGTCPVGQLKPNDLGLFDMLGNVSEWCQDRYMPYPQGPPEQASEDREDTTGITAGTPRALRGGAFDCPAEDLRSAYRLGKPPTAREPTVGLRVARTHR